MKRAIIILVFSAALLALGSAHAQAASAIPGRAEIYFRLAHPCPSTGHTSGPCKGYVIDRIVPRICGGADDPSNMQWQTIAEAKAKDRWERIGCRPGRKQVMPTTEAYTEAFPLHDAPTASDVQATPLQ